MHRAAKVRSLGPWHRLLLCALPVLLAFVPATADAALPPREQAELRALAAPGLKLETAVERREAALKQLSSELAAEYSAVRRSLRRSARTLTQRR